MVEALGWSCIQSVSPALFMLIIKFATEMILQDPSVDLISFGWILQFSFSDVSPEKNTLGFPEISTMSQTELRFQETEYHKREAFHIEASFVSVFKLKKKKKGNKILIKSIFFSGYSKNNVKDLI